MLSRVLEPEVMDSLEEAAAYDAMDHTAVNAAFVDDLLAAAEGTDCLAGEILDLGTGTAQIPIELCRRSQEYRVVAVDLSVAMLEQARLNVDMADLLDQILLVHLDAKSPQMLADGRFRCVMSNSIVHHIPQPREVIDEAWRVLAPGGLLFMRDLLRPADEATLEELVATHVGQETPFQQKMFADSLRAALTLEEMRDLAEGLGLERETVQQTTDRHWTWIARRGS